MTRSGSVIFAPAGCTDPDRWTDAYLIAEAHRAEKGVCACGRPLPCIAAQRADEIMAATMVAARAAEEAARTAAAIADEQRRISRAITQELPVLVLPEPEAPVGARFYRPKQRDQEPEPPPAPVGIPMPLPAAPAAPTGARFYRERKPPRHRG